MSGRRIAVNDLAPSMGPVRSSAPVDPYAPSDLSLRRADPNMSASGRKVNPAYSFAKPRGNRRATMGGGSAMVPGLSGAGDASASTSGIPESVVDTYNGPSTVGGLFCQVEHAVDSMFISPLDQVLDVVLGERDYKPYIIGGVVMLGVAWWLRKEHLLPAAVALNF